MFIPMFYFVIRYCRDKKTLSAAFDTARDFINKNYQWGKCDFYVERTIAMIANGTLERPKTALFGLIRTKERPDSKKIRFCGIPVYQIKYFPDYRKHYLLGIQYLIKHLRDHE